MHRILMVSTLLLSLVRSVWAIEPDAARGYIPVVAAILKGTQNDFSKIIPTSTKSFNAWAAPRVSGMNLVTPDWRYGFSGVTTKNSIALIPLNGAVMKYDYCGSVGTKTLQQYFMQVENNPALIGSIFINDSPGGEVGGTGNLADLIYSLKKPVIGYVDGMSCSASYWPISSCDEVIASYKTDIIGSIGTFCTLADYSKQLEMEGIDLHQIYATKSTEKNSIYQEALNGNYEPIRKQLIDPLNESFHSGVKRNRYGKGLNSKVLAGGTYMANDAINNGLIDALGSIDYAIERVQKLAL